jgi:hypothetical protein
MTRTNSGIVAPSLDPTSLERRVADAARRLYDAEVALHNAHQTRVDAWISAASDKLHEAIETHLAASAALARSSSATPRARTAS